MISVDLVPTDCDASVGASAGELDPERWRRGRLHAHRAVYGQGCSVPLQSSSQSRQVQVGECPSIGARLEELEPIAVGQAIAAEATTLSLERVAPVLLISMTAAPARLTAGAVA